ncbi:MAG TPA: hypothetical protein VFZ48_05290 [Candidatus Saccharimonadales bacterium]
MRIHPAESTPIADIVMHHFRPHLSEQADCRLIGATTRFGLISIRPALAQMLDKVLAGARKDLQDRGATEIKMQFSAYPMGFVLQIEDNGRAPQQVPSMLEAARQVGSDLEWLSDDGWNTVKLTCGFRP